MDIDKAKIRTAIRILEQRGYREFATAVWDLLDAYQALNAPIAEHILGGASPDEQPRPWCGAFQQTLLGHAPYMCTREAGHTGNHHALGGEFSWTDPRGTVLCNGFSAKCDAVAVNRFPGGTTHEPCELTAGHDEAHQHHDAAGRVWKWLDGNEPPARHLAAELGIYPPVASVRTGDDDPNIGVVSCCDDHTAE